MPCVRELLEIFIELKRLRADGIKARRYFVYRQYTDLRLIVQNKYVVHSNIRHTLFILLPKKVILYFMVTTVGL